jgi:FkbH-like protein
MNLSKSKLIKKSSNFFSMNSSYESSDLLKFINHELESKNDFAKHFIRVSANTHGFKQNFYESLLAIFHKYSIKQLKPNTKKISLLVISDVTTIYFYKLIKIFGISIGLDINISSIEDDKIGYRDDLVLDHQENYDLVFLFLSDSWLSKHLEDSLFLNNKNFTDLKNIINNLLSITKRSLSKKIIFSGFTTKLFNFNETVKYEKYLSPNRFVWSLNNFIEDKQDENFAYLNLNSIVSNVGGSDNYFSRMYTIANYPFEEKLSIYFSRALTSLIADLFKQSHRLLVTDLDNTQWGGEVADLGFENVIYGEDTPTGRDFKRLQTLIRSLTSIGLNIAAISKNDPSIEDDFKKNKRFILNYKIFTSVMINLDNKSLNIANLEKNIGFNSDYYLYIDDSVFELVNIFIDHPYIDFILSKDASHTLSQLENLCFFKKTIVLTDDISRTENIKKLLNQNILRKKFKSNSEFLKNINIKLIISDINKKNFSRVKQLLLKSNQFNLTNKRYSELSELNFDTHPVNFLCVEYIDAFGSQGIISVICLIENDTQIVIDNFVMSCRVIRRSVENMILKSVLLNFKKSIIGKYVKSEKNKLVEDLYASLDFKYDSECDHWFMSSEDANNINTFVNKVEFKP